MTAFSELFVTETIRDLVAEKLKHTPAEISVGCPDNWRDIWADSAFPDEGTAPVYRDKDEAEIGSVSWKTSFRICGDQDEGRFMEAYVKPEDLKIVIEGKSITPEESAYVFYETTIADGTSEYGEGHVAEITGVKTDADIEKTLCQELLEQFGEEYSEPEKGNPRKIWESDMERFVQLDKWKRISKDHYDILKAYLPNEELQVKKT